MKMSNLEVQFIVSALVVVVGVDTTRKFTFECFILNDLLLQYLFHPPEFVL